MTAAPSTGNSAAQAQAANLAGWLQYAYTNPWTQLATLAAGSAGGASAGLFTLNPSDIPVSPTWCSAIKYQASIGLAVTLPAGASVTVSPYFPFSSLIQALTLAGAPPWNQLELTAWYLDEITSAQDFDPSFAGLGEASPVSASTSPYQDDGGNWNLGGLVPGATLTNSGTSSETTNYTVNFTVRQQLQRRRHLGFGLIPFGDNENRPQQQLLLSPTVGTNPEQNSFINASSAGVSVVTQGNSTVKIVYELRGIDITGALPKGVSASPTASFGLQVDSSSPSIQNAGSIRYFQHKTAMLYEKIHHLLINDELPIRADYFGLWITNVQQNSRWAFDASQNTFQDYYEMVHERYQRYLPKGEFVADLASGDIPQFPNATPYVGQMTPDVALATSLGIAPTPAMSTAIRVPSGTTMSGAYARVYSFGLVPVPY